MNEYSNWDFQDDDDDDGQAIDPRSLPKQLRKVIASAKKEAKEAKDEADNLRKQVRENAISNVLTSKGVPAKVAKLIPADITSAEAIETWLADYGDVFGSGQSASTQTTNQADTSNGQQFINDAATNTGPSAEEIAAMQRMQNTSGTAQPFGGRMGELQAKLNDPSLTEEQLDALIAKGSL